MEYPSPFDVMVRVLNTVFVMIFLTLTLMLISIVRIFRRPPSTSCSSRTATSGTIAIAPHSVAATPSIVHMASSLFLSIVLVLLSRTLFDGIATEMKTSLLWADMWTATKTNNSSVKNFFMILSILL